MRFLRTAAISLLIVIAGTIAFGALLLLFEPMAGFIAWLVLSVVLIGILILTIVTYIKQKRTSRAKPSTLSATVLTLVAIWLVSLALAFANFMLYQVEEYMTEQTALSAAQKLDYYKQFLAGPERVADLSELESTEKAGITFYYPKGVEPAKEISGVADFIQANKKRFEESLGGNSDAPFSVVLYSDATSMPESEAAEIEYKGLYSEADQTIHLPMPVDSTTLAHEYIHHLFYSIAKDRKMYLSQIPQWWNEGVATKLSQQGGSVPLLRMHENGFVEFSELTDVGGWENHLKLHDQPYVQSSTFIGYLMEQEGQDVISKIFAEMEFAPMPDSFEEVTGKTIEEYEKEFITDFKELAELWDEASLLETRDNESQKSLDAFLNLAETEPDLELINHRIANLYMKLGNYEKAIDYREKELQLAVAENRETLAATYGYLADSLLFTDVDKAVRTAERAVEVSDEFSLKWNENRLEELSSLKNRIEQGEPLQGYYEILTGEYIINNGSENQAEKIGLIDIALEKYSGQDDEGRSKLLALQQSLEKEATDQN